MYTINCMSILLHKYIILMCYITIIKGDSMDNKEIETYLNKLSIDPKLLGLTSLNQFSLNNSSPRGVMMLSQLSQAISLTNGDERIVQSGLETKLIDTLFKKQIKNESKLLAVIPKYRGVVKGDVDALIEVTLIYKDLITDTIEHMKIPRFDKHSNYFGFEYNWSDQLNNMEYGEILPAGTMLAQPKSVENDGYKFGANVNACLVSMHEVGEDAIIISESCREKFRFKLWETRRISFGGDVIPLNLYGDENEYKIFPDIGERVHDSGILMATRKFDEMLAPSLFSDKALREPNELFDECTYVRGRSGLVVNVEVIHTPKTRRTVFFSNTEDQAYKYSEALNRYNMQILNSCTDIKNDFGGNITYGNSLHRELVEIMALNEPDLENLYRKEPMNTFSIEITVEYDMLPREGYKLSGLSGDKGIISEIRKDEDMPIDSNGVRADLMMDPSSTISRMNIGRLYEAFFNGTSRVVKQYVTDAMRHELSDIPDNLLYKRVSDELVNSLFNYILEYLRIVGNKQFIQYESISNRMDAKRDILNDIVMNEFYVYFPIDNEVHVTKVVADLKDSIYAPLKDHIKYKIGGVEKISQDKISIAPMYVMLLSKIADTWLSTASSKI